MIHPDLKKILVATVALFTFIGIFIADEVFTHQSQLNKSKIIYSQSDLNRLLQPIASYPDNLLLHILTAATHPNDVYAADDWLQKNHYLKGDMLNNALEIHNWDQSVKSLIYFPKILHKMRNNMEWTKQVGEAFLNQKDDVINTIQKLRNNAHISGNIGLQMHHQYNPINPTNYRVIPHHQISQNISGISHSGSQQNSDPNNNKPGGGGGGAINPPHSIQGTLRVEATLK